MKKILLGLLIVFSLVLVGCSGNIAGEAFSPAMSRSAYTLEAEDFDIIDVFQIEQKTLGTNIKNEDNVYEATASTILDLEAGDYKITVWYFDESDGVGKYTVKLNGDGIFSWEGDKQVGFEGYASNVRSYKSVNFVQFEAYLKKGDKLTLASYRGTGELSAYDRVEFELLGPLDDTPVLQDDVSCGRRIVYDEGVSNININNVVSDWSKARTGLGYLYTNLYGVETNEEYAQIAITGKTYFEDVDCSVANYVDTRSVTIKNGDILCLRQSDDYVALKPLLQTSSFRGEWPQYENDHMMYEWQLSKDGKFPIYDSSKCDEVQPLNPGCTGFENLDSCLDDSECYWDQETNGCYMMKYKQTCSDSDGGKNEGIQGSAFGFLNGFPSDSREVRIRSGFEDGCGSRRDGRVTALENYCVDDFYRDSYEKECLYGCQDGACLEASSSSGGSGTTTDLGDDYIFLGFSDIMDSDAYSNAGFQTSKTAAQVCDDLGYRGCFAGQVETINHYYESTDGTCRGPQLQPSTFRLTSCNEGGFYLDDGICDSRLDRSLGEPEYGDYNWHRLLNGVICIK